MNWDFKLYTFWLPKTRSERLKDLARQQQLDNFIQNFRTEHGEPMLITVHKIGSLEAEDIPLCERRSTPPEHVFIWSEDSDAGKSYRQLSNQRTKRNS